MVELLGKEAPSQNTSKKSTSSGAAAVQLSTDQRTKLTDLIKATLVDMSDQGELKPVALKISKTRAKIWLAKADSAGALSFQIMNGTKQASFNFEELQPADHIMLSRLIAALRPKDAAAQAIAGLYIDSSGNKRLATSYFKKTNQEAVQEIVSSLQE
jgi:hypothetical protein